MTALGPAAEARTLTAPVVSVPPPLLYAVFFGSGFAALLYQIVWQRALFTLYGTNIEAVTVVVTAFMLGLGLGSLTGGALSANPLRSVLPLFAGMELTIGAYGLASLSLFSLVGRATVGVSPLPAFLLSFMLVLLPTLLMGATLPLLVAHLVRQAGNVGRAVGVLYAVNTLGAAVGALAAALLVLRLLGLQGSVWLAAAANVAVGLAVLASWVLGRWTSVRGGRRS